MKIRFFSAWLAAVLALWISACSSGGTTDTEPPVIHDSDVIVASEGGTVGGDADPFQLVIPANSLQEDTLVVLQTRSAIAATGQGTPLPGTGVEVGPQGLAFDLTLRPTLSLSYSGAEAALFGADSKFLLADGTGLDPDKIFLAKLTPDGSTWTILYSTTIDSSQMRGAAQIDGYGVYLLILLGSEGGGGGALSVSASVSLSGAMAPVTADFSSLVSGGTAPLQYAWDFGDGSPMSSAPAPQHVYEDQGVYDVSLTVADAAGASDSHLLQVRVEPALVPTAEIQADVTSGLTPFSVSFTGKREGGNPPFAYSWDFGDGSALATGVAVDHTYETSGVFEAVFTVTDADGDTASDSLQIISDEDRQPAAAASGSPSFGVAPLVVDFIGEGAGGNGVLSFVWDFGDGGASLEQSPTHVYAAPGLYTATLTVTDADGDAAAAEVEIQADEDLVPAVLLEGDPITGFAPLTVSFNAQGGGGNGELVYTWDFRDGGEPEVGPAQQSHTFDSPGNYNVRVTVTDADGDTGSASLTVKAEENTSPQAAFNVSTLSGAVPLEVEFSNTSTGGNPPFSYAWTFGDGAAAEGYSVSHVYEAPGDYTATLVVTDLQGDAGEASRTIRVEADVPAEVSIDISRDFGGAPLLAILKAQVQSGNPPLTFQWDFGDGTDPRSGAELSHRWEAPGTYVVTLTATDQNGDQGSATHEVVLEENSVPEVLVTANPLEGPNPLTVSFESDVYGGNGDLVYEWTFGWGNGKSSDVNTTYVYGLPGVYTATLKVTDVDGESGQDSAVITITGDLTPSVFAWADPVYGVDTLDTTLSATGAGGDPPYAYSWDFGDGSPGATGAVVSHLYTGAGEPTARVTVQDGDGDEASYDVELTIEADAAPAVSARASVTSFPVPLETLLTAEGSGGNGELEYVWDFGDGSPLATGPVQTHLYEIPGTYAAEARVADFDGDEASAVVNIVALTDLAPSPSVSASPLTGPAALEVVFNASTTGGNPPFTYSWDFGDGTAGATGPAATHLYETDGDFTAVVTVTDLDGDEAQADETISVLVDLAPEVTVSADVTSGIPPLAVAFLGTASGGNGTLTYAWDFGDGSPEETGAAAAHTYTDVGLYTAVLTVTDEDGDEGTDSVDINVEADTDPVPIIDADDYDGAAPFTAYLYASSSGGNGVITYAWDFGDGSPVETAQNVSHTYAATNHYTVTLMAWDADDTASHDTTAAIDVHSDLRPSARASASGYFYAAAPATVYFNGEVVGGDAPYAWSWDFGDGSPPSTAQSPSHEYLLPGVYSAVLTVTDDDGDADDDTWKVYVAQTALREVNRVGAVRSCSNASVSGSRAYLACGENGLAVCDLSNPAQPQCPYRVSLGDEALDVWADGTVAYAAVGASGLAVVDLSSTPELVGRYDSPGAALGVYSDGVYVYLADGFEGLRILDASDPAKPRDVGGLDLGASAQDVIVSGGLAYVAMSSGRVAVVDVSDPTIPFEADSLAVSFDVRGLSLDGTRLVAYGSDGQGRASLIDIAGAPPPYLTEVQSYAFAFGATEVLGAVQSGDVLYVARDGFGVLARDVSTPAAPVDLGAVDPPLAYAGGLAVSSAGVLLASEAGLVVLDPATTRDPPLEHLGSAALGASLTLDGTWSYVAADAAGLVVLDLSVTSPTIASTTLFAGGAARDVAVDSTRAFVAAGAAGVALLDAANPAAPVPASTYVTTQEARGISFSSGCAYVAADSAGLVILDYSTTSPVKVGQRTLAGPAYAIDLDPPYAYIAMAQAGLAIADVHTTSAPTVLSRFDTAGDVRALYRSGNYVYLADRGVGLTVVNAANKTGPTLAGTWLLPEDPIRSLHGSGTLLAASTDGGLLLLFDISTPAAPRLVASLDTGATGGAVCLSGTELHEAGLIYRVYDVSSPAGLRALGAVSERGESVGLAASSAGVFTAEGRAGMRAMAFTSYDKLVHTSLVPAHGQAAAVGLSGNYAMIGEAALGLTVYDASTPAAPLFRGRSDGYAGRALAAAGAIYTASGASGVGEWNGSPTNPGLRGYGAAGGVVSDFRISGAYILAAAGAGGFAVLDASTTPPSFIYNLAGGEGQDLAQNGGYYYMVNPFQQLMVYEASDPASVTAGPVAPTSFVPRSVAYGDGLIFVSEVGKQLEVFDASNPAAPAADSLWPLPTEGYDLYYGGGYLLVTGGEVPLYVFRVNAP